MNFIFISPHFPHTYWEFCQRLQRNGVRVLGIADAPYDQLSAELKGSLTEYYRVSNLENYDEVYRAVAFFAFKYGRIDWIESNNEYWLEQDARLRTDFHVTTGLQADEVQAVKEKSAMKKYFAKGGIPTARQIQCAEGYYAVETFAQDVGFPVIALDHDEDHELTEQRPVGIGVDRYKTRNTACARCGKEAVEERRRFTAF